MTKSVRVFDTTLRDGEQTPGVSLTPDQKLEIANALDRLGVDVIEAGFPITSAGERVGVRMISHAGLKAMICCLTRAEKDEIDVAAECGAGSVHIFLASSDIHLKHKLHLTKEQMIEKAKESVSYAKSKGLEVEFSPEDATRTEIPFFKKVVKAVTGAGIDRLDIADTVGTATPSKIASYVKAVKEVSDAMVSVHCHDDYGLAVANSLQGVMAGAEQAHVTINGIGERAGNTSLEEFVLAGKNLFDFSTGIKTELLYDTSRMISRLTGVVVQPNKAVVGENAFGHKSGIHTHGVLANPLTYEAYDPALVGRKRWLQAGKHSGGHGVAYQLKQMGLVPDKDQLKAIVNQVKEIGDAGRVVTDGELYNLARKAMGKKEAEGRLVELEALDVETGTQRQPSAYVKLKVRGRLYEATEVGVGPVDAALNAIQKIIRNFEQVRLSEYRLEALNGTSDATADVMVMLEDTYNNNASGRGRRRDIVVGSVEAIVDGINALLAKTEKAKAPPAGVAESIPQSPRKS